MKLNIVLLTAQRNVKKRINIEFNPRKHLKNSYYDIFNNKERSDINL